MMLRQSLLECLRPLRKTAAFVLPTLALGLAAPAGAQVVISQILGGGSLTGTNFTHDFVELHNRGTTAQSLAGWTLQYAGATGSSWNANTVLTGSIPAGGYYLIRLATRPDPDGVAIPVTPDLIGSVDMGGAAGKVALVSNSTQLTGTCPSGGAIVDFVGYGTTANCQEGTGVANNAPNPLNKGLVRKSSGNTCVDSNVNSNDFDVIQYPFPRNTSSPAQPCVPQHCGAGIALTTTPTPLWQQFSLPCRAVTGVGNSTTNVSTVIGGGGPGKLDSALNPSRWTIWTRNPTNTGNVQMSVTANITVGTGHWIRSQDPPNGGTLIIDNLVASPTPMNTGVAGCQATDEQGGCVVRSVPTQSSGTRMIAHSLPYDVDWSKVRVRVNGATPVTPAAAASNGDLSSTFWIWNGTSYVAKNDTSSIGNLRYFRSFFVQVLPGGVGKTIDLLIPALTSTVAPDMASVNGESSAALPDAGGGMAISQPVVADAGARSSRNAWTVDLDVRNADTGWWATAKLGQWPSASVGQDVHDMLALAPFGQPYLTVVFPRAERRNALVDYSADLRPSNGFASSWDFEVRAQPLNSNVVLLWTAPAAVLNKSRIIDRDTGLVVYPTDPGYANGYPMTLNTPVRRLTWEYLGN